MPLCVISYLKTHRLLSTALHDYKFSPAVQSGLCFPFLSTFVIICFWGIPFFFPGEVALCCSVTCTFLVVVYCAFDSAWGSTMVVVCGVGVERLGSGHAQAVLRISRWDFKGFNQEVTVGSKSQRAEGE